MPFSLSIRERAGVRRNRRLCPSPYPFRERAGVRGNRQLWLSPSPFRERVGVRGNRWFGGLFRSPFFLGLFVTPEPVNVLRGLSPPP